VQSSESALAQRIQETVTAARSKSPLVPKVGLVLGSGLGAYADTLKDLVKVPFGELPHLPSSKVAGHAGNLCFGLAEGVPVVCMQGRVHLYEGHSMESAVHGARVMARLGAQTVLLTNAAGGLEASWTPGDLMLITDHLNLMAQSPLIGKNDEAVGPRFPDMTRAYDPEVANALRAVAKDKGVNLREGVYAGLLGPSYETPAEIRMLRVLGAQAVGMSTVPEVIALRHMGVRVGALSCITNLAAGITGAALNHAEVEEIAKAKRQELMTLLSGWIARIGAMS